MFEPGNLSLFLASFLTVCVGVGLQLCGDERQLYSQQKQPEGGCRRITQQHEHRGLLQRCSLSLRLSCYRSINMSCGADDLSWVFLR